ncbi:hypothetical protein K9N68_13565 [Kovacikia minuta CCNUW1]|uniref:hypothetical protein n=1 Tax=Kovacikia minuta TaxID=2931930 RepID=UPI001CCA9FA8|nr:hypothetical protein [Kovacikia minuta]UBF28778.1 hypothetical protein K9N68_13565 [Kovacikia minuta CCNUW1]
MTFRGFTIALATVLLWVLTTLVTPPALALVQIKLYDISYHECSTEVGQGTVTSGGGTARAANCFIVTGKAENNSGKPVVNADVFGRVYDANNDSVMQNRNRLGSIDEIPPGISDFEMRISVPATQPTPLHLEQFKAAGFSGTVRR